MLEIKTLPILLLLHLSPILIISLHLPLTNLLLENKLLMAACVCVCVCVCVYVCVCLFPSTVKASPD